MAVSRAQATGTTTNTLSGGIFRTFPAQAPRAHPVQRPDLEHTDLQHPDQHPAFRPASSGPSGGASKF